MVGMDPTSSPPPEVLSTSESLALMRDSVVGRLAVVVGGQPEIFPVNHVVDHGSVVFRTAAGTKLVNCLGAPVAFEADGYDVDTGQAWSVVVKGVANEIREREAVIEALALPLFPWLTSTKPRFVRIDPVSVSGRRFTVSGGVRTTP